jgi:hypothetical protein
MNPFSTWETFDSYAQVLTLILATLGVVLTGTSWIKRISERKKRQFTFWERVCFVIGALLLWVAFFSDNVVSSRREKRQLKVETTASTALTEAQEGANRLAALDPRKQPVGSLSAVLKMKVRGTNQPFNWDDSKGNAGWLFFNLSLASSADIVNASLNSKVLLVADPLEILSFKESDDVNYSVEFRMNAAMQHWNGGSFTVEEVEALDTIMITLLTLPRPWELVEGTATIMINSSIRKEFPIPPQSSWAPVITSMVKDGYVSVVYVGQGGWGRTNLPISSFRSSNTSDARSH